MSIERNGGASVEDLATANPTGGHDHRFACVSRVPLFGALSEADRHRIASIAVTRRYQRNEQVYRPGEEPGLHIVHRGRVKVSRLTEAGAEQLIRILSPGEFLGEATLLSDRPTDSFGVSLESSEVCTIGRTRMQELLRRHPSVAMVMLQTVSERLGTAEQMLSALTAQSVEQRLADHLLRRYAEAGTTRFRLTSTKKDLASYLGTTPETLSRRLGSLQDGGLIKLGPGRAVEILDSPALHRLVAGR